jgi:hypothetical protein
VPRLDRLAEELQGLTELRELLEMLKRVCDKAGKN